MIDGTQAEHDEQQAQPLISVIMPCFNAAAHIEEAVRSVMGQTLQSIELIVIDDGSTDNSPEIVSDLAKAFPRRIRHSYQTNSGPYVARNCGLRMAKGEFVAFLDADDWWSPDCLEKLLAELQRDPSCALAYCGWQNVGLTGGRGAPYVPPDYEREDKASRFLRGGAPWPIHAALVRKKVIDEVGGFRLDLPTSMDYDLWLRIGIARPIRRVPEVLAFYRHHQLGQITSNRGRQARNSWLVKRRFIREHPEWVKHLSSAQLRDLTDGTLLRRGYDNFWRRDLIAAQQIFRLCLFRGWWRAKDLYYLLPALLPARFYRFLVTSRDQ